MTYREFIASGLPPAPEPPELKRLRYLTMIACFSAALSLFVARSLDNQPPALALISLIGGFVALAMLVVFARRKFRHDLTYWTPDKVALHRGEPISPPEGETLHLSGADLPPPDWPMVR